MGGDLNGQPHLDAEAPSPEAAALIRIEGQLALQNAALSMILALITGHGIDQGQVNYVIERLGGKQSPIIKV